MTPLSGIHAGSCIVVDTTETLIDIPGKQDDHRNDSLSENLGRLCKS